MYRQAAVAGEFYPETKELLLSRINSIVENVEQKIKAKGVLSPHAGYLYSGSVAGAVYSRVNIPDCVVLLGPDHSGFNRNNVIMAQGRWATPLGEVEIDSKLAHAILEGSSHIQDAAIPHLHEHSLEVQVPFLQYFNNSVCIVPILVGQDGEQAFVGIGNDIAQAVKTYPEEVLIVASSDMSHNVRQEEAKRKDDLVLQAILNLDEMDMLKLVREQHITMCGYAPVAIMLSACKFLGARESNLVKYTTSGYKTGDFSDVVGYASIIVY